MPPPSRTAVIRQLRQKLRESRVAERKEGRAAVSTGVAALDRLLPENGLRPGMLVEWIAAGQGGGALTLPVLVAAGLVRRSGGPFVMIDERGDFYPPAAAALGIDLKQMVLVRPDNASEALWSLEQVLRCEGVAAALCRLGPLSTPVVRRLQLAAEAGGAVGLLVRPDEVRRQPSWADVRLAVSPLAAPPSAAGRRLAVELLRCRHGLSEGIASLEIDDETGAVRLVSELADSTSAWRA